MHNDDLKCGFFADCVLVESDDKGFTYYERMLSGEREKYLANQAADEKAAEERAAENQANAKFKAEIRPK